MKSELNRIIEKEKMEMSDAGDNSRRDFLKKAAMGGVALGGMMNASIEDTVAYTTQRVNRASSPSELRITDMRMAGRIIKLYTNQGIFGYGEVRDGGDPRYALVLKNRIVGQNPCNVEMIFKIIKQFGYHARQGGGVSGVEMALWDLCGKAYNVPAWQLLGGRYRDKIRLYADTPARTSGTEMAAAMRQRMEVE
jgi:L-alanine-DL-glutamate epimerase-like enolase superfamily enzyme